MIVYVLIAIVVPDIQNNDVVAVVDQPIIFQSIAKCEEARARYIFEAEKVDGKGLACVRVKR